MPRSPLRTHSISALARLAAKVVVAATVLATAASSASARTSGVGFTSLPQTVFEGQRVMIVVAVQPGVERCTLTIDYPGKRTDQFHGSPERGRAAWGIRIPAVPPGIATVLAACGRAGSVRGTMRIRWAVQAPKIVVTESGWSQRIEPYAGSTAGFGVALRNARARSDAVNVVVLVNFADATNRVLGSAQVPVMRIPAASTFYIGGQQSLITQTPVARIEVIVSAKSALREGRPQPLISDVGIVPNVDGYVSGVRGQLLNNHPRPVQSTFLGVVVRNAAGAIVGGGYTYAQGPLSLGAREFFLAGGTFRAIPLTNAASADVSPVATYPPR
jgi:hypothetical protein